VAVVGVHSFSELRRLKRIVALPKERRRTVVTRNADGNMKNGIAIISYHPPLGALVGGWGDHSANELANLYRRLAGEDNPSCVLDLQIEVANSAVVSSMYHLWREVVNGDGYLVCANYPKACMVSLTSIGISDLPRFELAATRAAALRVLEEKLRGGPSGSR